MPYLTRVLPKEFNNQFGGNRIALYFFYAITAVTLWRSQHHLFAPDGGAQSIATIPLDTYTQGGAAAVIGVFALWGLSQLVIGILYLLACVRYRSMIPLLYLLGILEYSVRALVTGVFKPIETIGTAPGAMANVPLAMVFTVMFVLSIWRREGAVS